MVRNSVIIKIINIICNFSFTALLSAPLRMENVPTLLQSDFFYSGTSGTAACYPRRSLSCWLVSFGVHGCCLHTPPKSKDIVHCLHSFWIQAVLLRVIGTCAMIRASSSCPLPLKKVTSFLISPVATQYGMASSLSSAISCSALLQHQPITIYQCVIAEPPKLITDNKNRFLRAELKRITWSRSEMSNIRPTGQIRPQKGLIERWLCNV